jgi:hypothetical protein
LLWEDYGIIRLYSLDIEAAVKSIDYLAAIPGRLVATAPYRSLEMR